MNHASSIIPQSCTPSYCIAAICFNPISVRQTYRFADCCKSKRRMRMPAQAPESCPGSDLALYFTREPLHFLSLKSFCDVLAPSPSKMAFAIPPGTNLSTIPAGAPPDGVTPNFVDPPSLSISIFIVISVLVLLMTIVVATRLYLNYRSVRKLGWDDCISLQTPVYYLAN